MRLWFVVGGLLTVLYTWDFGDVGGVAVVGDVVVVAVVVVVASAVTFSPSSLPIIDVYLIAPRSVELS